MSLYRVGGLAIDSDIPLPAAIRLAGGKPDCALRLDARRSSRSRPEWVPYWRSPDGVVSLSIARRGSEYLLRFRDMAEFRFIGDTPHVYARPARHLSLEPLAWLFLEQVVPLALTARGRHVLHASAVMTPDGAIAFLGPASHGKSTLAASLVADGCALISDDWLLLTDEERELQAAAGSPAHKLRADSLEAVSSKNAVAWVSMHDDGDKARLASGRDGWPAAFGRVPLHRVYVLARSDTAEDLLVEERPLSVREAFVELVRHSVRFDVDGRQRAERDADRFAALARLPVFHRLTFPRRWDLLPVVRDVVRRPAGDAPPRVGSFA